jgi:2-methylisocitrate lyase-like PEP mutase family enzyme
MTTADQVQRAKVFHTLHRQGEILVLVNAWDAASARVFELAGCPAVATTSAGLAWSLGYPDGERLPREDLVRAVAQICRVVTRPVSVDIERGFGRTASEACMTVKALIEVGAIGINIEDGTDDSGRTLAPPAELVEKIEAIRALAKVSGLPLFINARTDAYFLPTADPATRFADAVQRLRAYAAAGADGVFAPGLDDLDEIARLVKAVDRPVNIYAGYAGVPSVVELARVGVRRVSVGCGPMQALLAFARTIATELGTGRTYAAMTDSMLSVAEVNGMFPAIRER